MLYPNSFFFFFFLSLELKRRISFWGFFFPSCVTRLLSPAINLAQKSTLLMSTKKSFRKKAGCSGLNYVMILNETQVLDFNGSICTNPP